MQRLILACLLGACAQAAPAQQQSSIALTEAESASGFSRQIGRRLRFICPAIATPNTEVWGTDVYANQSVVCTAAIHAGVLPMGQAGIVSIVIGEGGPFAGSERHDVRTRDYGNRDYSYTFDRGTEPAAIDWSTNALRMPQGFDQPMTVICPPAQKTDAFIWGTDTYITDSAICVAAVHGGVITLEGGAVVVTRTPGLDSYTASMRHGMSSIAWSAWPDAFQLSRGQAGAGSPGSASGRTIHTAGFTAAGNSAEVEARRIRLPGFTGEGEATIVAPRTIRTNGWTGTGPTP